MKASGSPYPAPTRGPFIAGDHVQLTGPKKRHYTIVLDAGARFHTSGGYIEHDDLIGQDSGITITNTAGITFLVLRPLLADFVMSMPRGAAIVYPKDAGQIVTMAGIFPGARVIEAGVGSGALSLYLLSAIGPEGHLDSVERRAEFAAIARGNVTSFFGQHPDHWDVYLGDVQDHLFDQDPGSIDRVVLDMLSPWECVESVAHALTPGGVVITYVATATQLSRVAEEIKSHGGFTEPMASETMVREWHLDGLAVRPEHRMHAHTGFLLTARRLAPGYTTPKLTRRPAKGSAADPDAATTAIPNSAWTSAALGERPVSARKVRKLARAGDPMYANDPEYRHFLATAEKQDALSENPSPAEETEK